jgi:RNA polymerase sigma-70 factor (ECF subfamily)
VSTRLKTSEHKGRASLVQDLQLVAKGDRAALGSVYDATSAKLMGICLRILKDRDEAEDVVQEIYVSVWSRAGSFDGDKASPITWLATIARNRAIDRLRTRKSRGQSAGLDEVLQMPDEGPDGFAAAAAKDESRRIQYCLGTLEKRAERVIRIAFFDGLSYPELADRIGVPLGTIKSWIRRGLLRLRECLSQ